MFNHKIVLLGSTGYVGSYFVKHLAKIGINFVTPTRNDVDVFDPFQLSKYLIENKATFLINCIGFTGKPNVDACEDAKEECLRVNAFLPARISLACNLADVNWGHVSSGCIYNGYHKDYTEDDEPNFVFGTKCSYYSGTKALGEAFLKDDSRSYVWRLRVPFSNVNSSRNYISKIMKCNKLNWCWNSLTDVDEFCQACIECITEKLPRGIYNLTNPGCMTASEVIDMVREFLGSNHSFTEHNPNELHPIVPRSNCVLNTDKSMQYGIRLTPIKIAIEKALMNWVE